jgi:hypothetical protein
MGNAAIQEAYYNRTFWQAALEVLPNAVIQTLALIILFLLALGVARTARLNVNPLHLFMMAILISFAVWPILVWPYLHIIQPNSYADWFPAFLGSVTGLVLVIVWLNLPAAAVFALWIMAFIAAGWLSTLRFRLGYAIAFLILPAAWLCECYPGPPR